MWVVIYMAEGKKKADKVLELLTNEGFLVKTKPVYKNTAPEDNYYEIIVPKSEAHEAHKAIVECRHLM
ncbi:MAG: hypothetical protein GX041_01155 [Clostridiales bacterium]|nr:hypothetical protein [Clostridiales bacterium]